MPTQTEEQRQNALRDAGIAVPTGAITSADLAAVPSVDTAASPSPRDYQPKIDSSLEALLANFNATTPQETAQNDLGKQLEALTRTLGTESTRKNQLEQQAGLPEKNKELQSVINQLQALSKERAAIPLQIQQDYAGTGATVGGIAPIEAGRTRENTIKALGLAAIGQTLQGDITLANATIQSALDAEFEPIRNEIEVAKLNYQNNKDMLERIDKKRADNLNIILNERTRLLGIQEANKKEIYDIGKLAGQYGADSGTVQKIMAASTREEAAALAGTFLQDPMAKQQLENAKLANVLTKAQINKTNYELSVLKKYGGMSPSEYRAYQKEQKKEIDDAKDEAQKSFLQAQALDEKATKIDAVLNSKALDAVIGPTFLTRSLGRTEGGSETVASFFTGGLLRSGAELYGADDVVANIEQIISKEFLDNLIEVKAQGATFGALTKPEQDALTAAALSIGQTRIKRGKGEDAKVVGYDMSEAAFRKELETVQTLARTAYERSVGKSFTPEEEKLLNELGAAESDINFDPTY